jgi:hypothetical protein
MGGNVMIGTNLGIERIFALHVMMLVILITKKVSLLKDGFRPQGVRN